MSERSGAAARVAALGLLTAPALVALGGFAVWAVGHWTEAGRRLAAAEARLHEAEARMSQVQPYELLGEAWADFAAAEGSGLVQEPDESAARAALASRVRAAFDAVGGAAYGVAQMPADSDPGVQRLRLEVGGRIPAAALPALLTALEAEPPYLHVDLLDLRADAAAADGSPGVALRLRLSAYRLTGVSGRGAALTAAVRGEDA